MYIHILYKKVFFLRLKHAQQYVKGGGDGDLYHLNGFAAGASCAKRRHQNANDWISKLEITK
jgi:hypothetical protein